MLVKHQGEQWGNGLETHALARPAQALLSLLWFTLRVLAVLGAIKLAYLFAAWAAQ